MNRFLGGLGLKAHRLVYHSTLGSRVIKKKNIADICATYHKEKADDPAAWYSPQFKDNFAEM